MQKNLIGLIIACLFFYSAVFAQARPDTLRISLSQAEGMFLDSNLLLLAQRYQIDAAKAQVIQARLWPNPNFSIGHTLYSGTLHQFFPVGNHDETTAGLSQLILLAGKRNKQVRIAQQQATLTEYQFFDLLRTLKYTLRTDFFNVYYLRQSEKAYDREIRALSQIVDAFSGQQAKGNISEKELVRIKAQLYSFRSEYNDLINQINDVQSELRLLLQAAPVRLLDPIPDSVAIGALDPARYPLNQLIDSALQNRTDLRIARANRDLSKMNYDYQRSLAVPDLTLSLGYDEAGSYLNGYYGIGASIDLPFFNRNQGNIKAAKAMIGANEVTQRSTEATVQENVSRALQRAFAQDKLFHSIDPAFFGDFERLMHEVLVNYEKRNISILDFLDFYDSYKQNVLQLNSVRFNRVTAFEDINFYTGTNFFN
jgi:outer membrane protein, heavy metal efflux system